MMSWKKFLRPNGSHRIVLPALFIVLLVFSILPIFPAYAEDTGWLQGWTYRIPITVHENSGNTLTNYTVKIVLNTSNFDYSKCKSDGSDIRFTASDGVTLLSYWIEKWNSTGESVIWVKVPEIPAGQSIRIYMYYGNENALAESNPDNVFVFYDDFEYSSLDQDKWPNNAMTNGQVTISPGIDEYSLILKGLDTWNYASVMSRFINYTNVAITVTAKYTHYEYNDDNSAIGFAVIFYNQTQKVKSILWLVKYDGSDWRNIEWPGNPFDEKVDWNLEANVVMTKTLITNSYVPDDAVSFKLLVRTQNCGVSNFYVDNVIVRKYVPGEPTVTLGSEEIVNDPEIFASVDISVNVPATVYVNNTKYENVEELNLTLIAGHYVIKAVKEGYKTWIKEYDFVSNKTYDINIILEKKGWWDKFREWFNWTNIKAKFNGWKFWEKNETNVKLYVNVTTTSFQIIDKVIVKIPQRFWFDKRIELTYNLTSGLWEGEVPANTTVTIVAISGNSYAKISGVDIGNGKTVTLSFDNYAKQMSFFEKVKRWLGLWP